MNTIYRFILGPALIGIFAAVAALLILKGEFQGFRSADEDSTRPFLQRNSDSGPVSYSAAVENAAPAVVNIYTTKIVERQVHPLFNDPVFRRFFGLENSPKTQRMQSSLGSGVIVSTAGYVLTNNHVIKDAVEIYVALRDGREATAKVVGTDPETDLAVLKIQLEQLPAIDFGPSKETSVGDVVMAIGNPYGFGQTVTMGIISAKGRGLQLSTYEDFIQTDAAINPGNSGGALINAYGQLIGINTAIFSQSGGSLGIGFAIPALLANDVLTEIIQYGRVVRGWLGIRPQVLDPEMGQRYSYPPSMNGVIIADLYVNGPADKAGLRPGDLITAINGITISNEKDAMNLIANKDPESQVVIDFLRQGQSYRLAVTVGERPRSKPTR